MKYRPTTQFNYNTSFIAFFIDHDYYTNFNSTGYITVKPEVTQKTFINEEIHYRWKILEIEPCTLLQKERIPKESISKIFSKI